ncbi:peptidoglycan-binding protein [Streptomyces nitrosporeus]|uniref:Peptidoglycan-binding protein n=1 Tax=Streptomyces nitrosporeus TaxID=28894 RepID=A0A5J6F8U8_9ACTN|nr:peptidoglycan-binding domain-containing protein [Streptomyces nitrosporeus]QEU71380.1 peptidoglycan-binding protein [Streptomyces nitrosporeus]GGY98329.1 hypothetical protein GCM10010327_31020 [Streptomyces nitrosporeus]
MYSTVSRFRPLRRAAVPFAAATLALGIAATAATPAAASNSYNGRAYVYGTGTMLDDLNDEGAVNTTTNRLSNATCLWQTILWADGYLPRSGADGAFGPQTRAATVAWQRDRGLAADGSAGKLTWGKAGKKISFDGVSGGKRYGGYHGKNWTFMVRRADAGGNWEFASANGGIETAGYNTRTC